MRLAFHISDTTSSVSHHLTNCHRWQYTRVDTPSMPGNSSAISFLPFGNGHHPKGIFLPVSFHFISFRCHLNPRASTGDAFSGWPFRQKMPTTSFWRIPVPSTTSIIRWASCHTAFLKQALQKNDKLTNPCYTKVCLAVNPCMFLFFLYTFTVLNFLYISTLHLLVYINSFQLIYEGKRYSYMLPYNEKGKFRDLVNRE